MVMADPNRGGVAVWVEESGHCAGRPSWANGVWMKGGEGTAAQREALRNHGRR